MGVIKAHEPAENCICCPPGGGTTIVRDVLPLSTAQRLAFIQAWQTVCRSRETPPEVLQRICAMAAGTRTRLVRRQIIPNFDSLSLCGEADF
jgi:hypothetical protein